MWKEVLASVALAAMVGCSTMFPPPPRPVSFQSIPPGATVRVNGEIKGVTPFATDLDCSKGAPQVAFDLPGHQVYQQQVPTQDVMDHRGSLMWPVKQCHSVVSVPLRPTR